MEEKPRRRQKIEEDNNSDKGNLIVINPSKQDQYYRTINLTSLLDKNLSFKAKGIHNYIMTRPNNWSLWTKSLFSISTNREASVRAAINELIKNKYLFRTTIRDEKKKIKSWIYIAFSTPTEITKQDLEKLDLGFLKIDNQVLDNQVLDNQAHSNKIYSKKNNSNSIINNTIDKKIYTHFLDKWKEIGLSKTTLKYTSKRETSIKKALKDYSQEEIFNSFQNYHTVLNSPDYFWDYKWTLEDFLQRGLHKFVDEAEPLTTYKTNSFQNNQSRSLSSSSKSKYAPPEPVYTKEAMHLFFYEDIDEFKSSYIKAVNRWMNSGVWQSNYIPDENRIHQAMVETKQWINNIIDPTWGKIKNCLGTLEQVCEEYIDWIERQSWLDEPGREIQNTKVLYPESGMFKLFIKSKEGDIMDIPIRSRGWGQDEDLKALTPDEIVKRKEREEAEQEQAELQKEEDEEKRIQNIEWAHNCMRKHLLDLGDMNINKLEIMSWLDMEDWKVKFTSFIINVEKRHQESPESRNCGYLFLVNNFKI